MIFADQFLTYCYKANREFKPKGRRFVKAKTIRDILTSGARELGGSAAALRMRGASTGDTTIYIIGTLDLKDGFGADGNTMPAFVATNCRFVTEPSYPADPTSWPLAQIELTRANLDRLSLRGSAFAQLRADNCFIDGDCDLGAEFGENVTKLDPCHVRLDGADITGSLYLSGRRFEELEPGPHGREEKTQRPPYYRNCALDVSNARIGRDVQIVRPDITGVLNGRGIVVGGSIRMMAVTARPKGVPGPSRSGKTIDFQYARVTGNFSIKGALDSLGDGVSSINGTVFLNAARIDGDLIVKEGTFSCMAFGPQVAEDDKRKTAIDLRDVIVGGNVHIGADAEDNQATMIGGAIVLDYATIGGGLQFDRVEPLQPLASAPHCNLEARGITVKQNLSVQRCRWIADPATWGIKFCALDLWKCTIGLGVKIDQQTTIRGSIRINNGVVARGVMIRSDFDGDCDGYEPEGHAIETRIDVAATRIDGDLRINAGASMQDKSITVDGAISLNQTVVSGRTVLENLRFRYREIPAESRPDHLNAAWRDRREKDRLSDNRRTIINLNGLEARGGFIVRNLSWEVCKHGVFIAPRSAPDPYPPMKFWKFPLHVYRDLILNSALAIIDARGMQGAFLNDDHGAAWRLHESHYLKLDQIDIGRIEEDEGHHLNSSKRLAINQGETPLPQSNERKMRLRLMFLAHQATRIRIFATNNYTPFVWWRSRFFTPQPFDNIARAYIRRGDLAVGRKLLIRRTDVEHWRRARDLLIGSADPVAVVARQVAWLLGPACRTRRLYQLARKLYRLRKRNRSRKQKRSLKAVCIWRRRYPVENVFVATASLATLPRRWSRNVVATLRLPWMAQPYGPRCPFRRRIWAAWQVEIHTVVHAYALARLAIGIVAAALYVVMFKAFRWLFGYGLEPGRAVVTMLGFIVLGVIGAEWARSHTTIDLHWPITVARANDPRRVAEGDFHWPLTLIRTEPALIKAAPEWPAVKLEIAARPVRVEPDTDDCDIDSISYAVDTFIPLLDMNFEAACKIVDITKPKDRIADDTTGRIDPFRFWRWALLLYEIAGWIVTSLTILTISGVIRRDVDK